MRHRPMTIKNLNPFKLLSALIGCLNRLVSRIKWWQATLAVLALCVYNDSAIILRVNHVGLVIKHADSWIPEFQTKAELLSD